MHLGLAAAMLPIGVSAQDATKAATAPKTAPPKSPWAVSVSAALKETFDSNVYLQSHEARNAPPPGVTWAQADQSSMVTTFIPSVGVAYKPSALFNASLTYAPELGSYHAESSEDYVSHKGTLGVTGKSGNTSWDLAGALTFTDGSNLGLNFDPSTTGAPPAAGGVPIRDRRDQTFTRDSFKLTHTYGKWMFRPLATFYWHDFQTEQHTEALDGARWRGYQNYNDRWEAIGGLDVGYQAFENTYLLLGYRYGHQNQAKLRGSPYQYDSDISRPLVGIEGKPWKWLTLNGLFGPDFRNWDTSGGKIDSRFEEGEIYYFWDASGTAAAGKLDSITLRTRSFRGPSAGGAAINEDLTYELSWKHKFDDRLTSAVGLRAYSTDFEAPSVREDWIITPSLVVAYAFNKQWNAEFSYSFDRAFSEVPDMPGREYDRHLVALGARYVFK